MQPPFRSPHRTADPRRHGHGAFERCAAALTATPSLALLLGAAVVALLVLLG